MIVYIFIRLKNAFLRKAGFSSINFCNANIYEFTKSVNLVSNLKNCMPIKSVSRLAIVLVFSHFYHFIDDYIRYGKIIGLAI